MSRKDNFQRAGESEDRLDQQIRNALNHRAESLPVTSRGAERLEVQVHRRIEEDWKMKKCKTRQWSKKKVMVVVAAVCILGSITAVAAGKVTSSSSFSSHNDEVKEYAKVKDLVNGLGFQAKTPESFSNGYKFGSAMPVHDEGMDDDGNVVMTGNSIHVTYKKDGAPDVNITVQESSFYDSQENVLQTFQYKGINLRYSSDNYLFVPPDYELTAEEQAQADAGELYVSYGTDQVERNSVNTLSWEDGGHLYMALSFDNPMSPDEYYQMACEIIDMP